MTNDWGLKRTSNFLHFSMHFSCCFAVISGLCVRIIKVLHLELTRPSLAPLVFINNNFFLPDLPLSEMHSRPLPLGQVLHGWMHPFLFGLNLAWPTPERSRSSWKSRSRRPQMAAPGRRKMQFPFSIFHMRIKRLFHISICRANWLHGAFVPFGLAHNYCHLGL